MKLVDVIQAMKGKEAPVILLVGTRDVPEAHRPKLMDFSAYLAIVFPNAVFRSGNADGADTFFAHGVKKV